MDAKELFKDFLKFYKKANPMGMGASKAKEIKVGYPTRDGMHYPDYDENASQTLPAVYDPDAPDPDYEQELYESGDSFSDIVGKRAAAASALADKVKGGVSDLATRFATGAELRDKQLAEDAAGFIAKSDEELSGMDPLEYERPKVTGLSIEEDAADFNDLSDAELGGIDSSVYEQEELYGDSDPLDFSYPAERSTEEYGKEDQENSDAEASMEDDIEMQRKAAKAAKAAKKSDRKAQRRDRKAHLKSSKEAFGTKSRDKSRKSKGGYVDPQGGEPLIATEAGRTIDEIAAPDSEVDYADQAIALFKNTHGTSFDPKSKMDKGKLEKMKSLLAEMGGMGEMTPNQFALQVYRSS